MKLNRDNFLVQVKYADLLADAGNVNKYFLDFGGELYLDAAEITNYDPHIIDRVKAFALAEHLPLKLHAPIIEIDYSRIRKSILHTQTIYEHVLKFCKILDINSVTTHADFDYKGIPAAEKQLDNAVILWRKLSGTLKKGAIGLNIENHFETEPDYLLRLMSAVKSHDFAMCVDVGHLAAFGNSSIKDWLKKYPAGSIREIHLADNLGDGDTHLPLGRGNIDFDNFFEILSRRNEKQVFILEPRNIEEAKESLMFLKEKGCLECDRT